MSYFDDLQARRRNGWRYNSDFSNFPGGYDPRKTQAELAGLESVLGRPDTDWENERVPSFRTMDYRPDRDGAFIPQTMDYRPDRDGHYREVYLSAAQDGSPVGANSPASPGGSEGPSQVGASDLPRSPWRDIDKDKLTGILYNEMSSFRGKPQDLEQAMWATAGVIMNRQAAGIENDIENKRVASPVISDDAWKAIRGGYKPAQDAYNMANQVADLITSAPEAFPSPWPYTHYNHRDTDSKADHATWGMPVMQQYGPFDTYDGKKWLNIFGPKRR